MDSKDAIAALHYASPAALLLWYLTAPCLFPQVHQAKRQADGRTRAIQILLICVILTFILDVANIITHALIERGHGWFAQDDLLLYLVTSIFIYGVILVSFVDKPPILSSAPVRGLLIIATLMEAALLALFRFHNLTAWGTAALVTQCTRIGILLISAGLTVGPVKSEEEPLLQSPVKHYSNPRPINHNAPNHGDSAVPSKAQQDEGWLLYLKKFTVFFPHLWPKGNFKLQAIIVFCGLLLLLARVLNVLVPRQLGVVADELSGDVPATTTHIWAMVLLYVLYRFLQGNMGVVGALRSYLWIPVGQYTYRSLAVSSFQHVHSLSLDFHIAKKTGEVLSALDKGSAINGFLEQLAFNVLPVIVDLFVAIVYFFIQFDAYFALIVAMMTVTYLYATVKITEWRTGIRRDMVNKSREEYAVKADSITNYETVKYFNAEAWEFNRYEEAVKTYQAAEWKVLGSLNVMNVTQNLIFALGLLATCLLSAYRVTYGKATIGSFVALLTYMAQLQGPLNFFGTLYRSLQSNLVNAERMLELFTQGASIQDKPDAKPIALTRGEVAFDNVHFAYDARKPALRGLSFTAKPGVLALVGESGAGKTTILRTLFRFYDIQEGRIMIDSQDIRDVKIQSLREQIGVVPQDTVLFNDTIMFNIRYAKLDATDEEVYEAARKAQIHDKIVDWPDGYNSKVGERGLRLSGGEKQRIAIARTILKNPRIILLDEATSALDTTTEREIQAALDELSRGRVSIVIAHRLSTIIGADCILCLKDGVVVEQGTHESLLEAAERNGGKGEYYSMWQKQIRAEKRMKRRQSNADELETAETSEAEASTGNAVQVPDTNATLAGSSKP